MFLWRGIASFSRLSPWLLASTLLLGGCASLPLEDAQRQFHQGKPAVALATLERGEGISKRDRLLLYMEKGSILHALGEYETSSKVLLKAAALMETQDYISLSEEASTLVTNDSAARFKGEYSEKLWVHTYQMMNFLLLGEHDSAAVEARRALKVFALHGDSLHEDGFTQALIGISFESVGKPNDAYIVYKKLAEKQGDDSPIIPELYRLARFLGFTKEAEKYRGLLTQSQIADAQKTAEVIVFVASGAIPRKVSSTMLLDLTTRVSFPRYANTFVPKPQLSVEVNGEPRRSLIISTTLGEVAQASLSARGVRVFAKSAARVAAKKALVKDLQKSDGLAGVLLEGLFFLLEEADTRSWRTLPAHLSLLRIRLPSGNHSIVVASRQSKGRHALVNDAAFSAGMRVFHSSAW